MTKERKTQMKKSSSFSETGLPFGKPQSVKRKEEKYPALFTEPEWAYQKGKEKHHIYGAANRHLSEKYGLYVYLSQNRHLSVTDNIDKEFVTWLKQEGQRRFMKAYGATEQTFYEIFKKMYL
jgi:hypothetical protein